jgi:hypothetical protein
MIAAEAALDAFWRAANAHWLRYVGTTPIALVQHLIGGRTLQRTSPWTEPSLARPLTVSPIVASSQPGTFPGHAHDISKQITGNFSKLTISAKEKKKTRGHAAKDGPAVGATVARDTVSPTPTIPVDKRAQKMFNSLFHSPNAPNQPGDVA